MTDHNKFHNKNLYKIFLSVVKFVPITTLCIKIIGTVLNFLNIVLPILTYLGGTSILFMVLLYLISYVFNYCYLYKMPLYYMTGLDIFILTSPYFLSVINIYRSIFIMSGLFMVSYIIYAYKNRHKESKDLIRDLCERMCNC